MNLNWECGKQHLRTSCVFYMQLAVMPFKSSTDGSCSSILLCKHAELGLPRSYREVPTFGRDTIRHFSRNASGMKKLAGRDFEDLLQVSSRLWY